MGNFLAITTSSRRKLKHVHPVDCELPASDPPRQRLLCVISDNETFNMEACLQKFSRINILVYKLQNNEARLESYAAAHRRLKAKGLHAQHAKEINELKEKGLPDQHAEEIIELKAMGLCDRDVKEIFLWKAMRRYAQHAREIDGLKHSVSKTQHALDQPMEQHKCVTSSCGDKGAALPKIITDIKVHGQRAQVEIGLSKSREDGAGDGRACIIIYAEKGNKT